MEFGWTCNLLTCLFNNVLRNKYLFTNGRLLLMCFNFVTGCMNGINRVQSSLFILMRFYICVAILSRLQVSAPDNVYNR